MSKIVEFKGNEEYTLVLVIPPSKKIVFLSIDSEKSSRYFFSDNTKMMKLLTEKEAKELKEIILQNVELMNINRGDKGQYEMPFKNIELNISKVLFE